MEGHSLSFPLRFAFLFQAEMSPRPLGGPSQRPSVGSSSRLYAKYKTAISRDPVADEPQKGKLCPDRLR